MLSFLKIIGAAPLTACSLAAKPTSSPSFQRISSWLSELSRGGRGVLSIRRLHQSLKAGQCMLCRRILQSLDHGVHCLLHLRVGHMSALCLMMDVIIASFGLKCQNVVRSLATICPYAGMG